MNTFKTAFMLARWPLSRILILVLAGAFGGLMMDIRVEHVDVVHQRSVGWMPIVYSGFMAIACLVTLVRWNKAARLTMAVLSLGTFVVGAMGFYFHNRGHLTHVINTSISAWIDPTMTHSDGAPQFAPLAFAGLGVLGLLASLTRFDSGTIPISEASETNPERAASGEADVRIEPSELEPHSDPY